MRVVKRSIALAGALFLVGALAAPAGARPARPAQGAEPTWAAEAKADALLLSLFGQELTVGSADTTVTSPDAATAEGVGALLVTEGFGSSSASATGVGSSDGSTDPVCSPIALPAEVPLLELSAACSTAIAAVDADGASSSATGQALTVGLGGDPLLQPILDALPISTITETLLGGLGGLLDTILPVPTDLVVDQVNELLNDALTGDGVTLLKIEAGGADAHTSSTADTVTATSTAKGVVIKVIDRGGTTFGTQPILTIEVGDSSTSVVRDLASGETTAESSGLVANVRVASDIAMILQLPEDEISVPLGQVIDLPLPSPLDSSIVLTDGVTREVEGGVVAESAVLDVHLLKGLNGGVRLAVGSGSTSVVGTVAEEAPAPEAPAPAPEAPKPAAPTAPVRTTLPRTGIEDSNRHHLTLVLALLGLSAGATVVVAGRRARSGA